MECTTRNSPARPLAMATAGSRRHSSVWRALGALAGAAALVTGTALAAYGSRDPLTARRDISGTYAVSTVAGKSVPATVIDTGLASPSGGQTAHLTIVITEGTVTLTPSGTYTADVAYTVTLNGDAQLVKEPTERGRYVVAGSTVTFMSAAGQVVATGRFFDGSLVISGNMLGAETIRRWCSMSTCTARAAA